MKILQVISHYMPAINFGGPLRVAHGLSKSLLEQGHEVTVCCLNMASIDSDLDVSVNSITKLDGVRVCYSRTPCLRYWGFSPGLLKRVYLEAKYADIVLIHFHYQFSSIVGAWCARLLKKPYIVFTHGSLNHHGVKARHGIFKKLYLSCFESKNFKSSKFMAYQSEMERQQSIDFGAKSLIVPIGIDLDLISYNFDINHFRLKYKDTENKFKFVYLGRLAIGKGLDLLLHAMHQLLNKGYDPYLLIIGGGERGYEKFLYQKVKKLNLCNNVMFTGILDGVEKYDVLLGANVFVLPSRSEGTSIATLEAMALGLPVIVTDRVCLSEDIIREKCGLVVPYDCKALQLGMENMINCKDLKEMGEIARQYSRKNYSWRDISEEFIKKITEGG